MNNERERPLTVAALARVCPPGPPGPLREGHAAWPDHANYQEKTERAIPVLVLTPVGG